MKKLWFGFISLLMSSFVLATSSYEEADKESYVIHGLKDLELQLEKPQPSLDYLVRRLKETEEAINIYGENGYQLTDGKHAKRYEKILNDTKAYIDFNKEHLIKPADLESSVKRQIGLINLEVARALIETNICKDSDDYIGKFKYFHSKMGRVTEDLTHDMVIESVLEVLPSLNENYIGLSEAEMRIKFEKDFPAIVEGYAKNGDVVSDHMGVQMKMPYDLVSKMGLEYGEKHEASMIIFLEEYSNSLPEVVVDVIANELVKAPETFCSNQEKPVFSPKELTRAKEIIKASVDKIKNLEIVKELQEGSHQLMVDFPEEGKAFDEELTKQAEKEKRIFR